MPRESRAEDRGFAAVWVAVVLLFLLGSAALAVDASEFWEDARFEQTVADLACLAGVVHLPEDPDSARQYGVAFAQANWPRMQTQFPVTTGPDQVTLSDGTSQVIITAPFGQSTKMKVEVVQEPDTRFGRLLGADSVRVIQESYCNTFGLGIRMLPFGELPGGFDGTIQEPGCGGNKGNCAQLVIPRDDCGSFANPKNCYLARNIALGPQLELDVGTILDTDTGESTNPVSDGFVREGYGIRGRLRDPGPNNNPWTSNGGRVEDGDPIGDVLVTQPATPANRPADYDKDLYGPWEAHRFVTDVRDCSSPRISGMPIVALPGWSPPSEPEWPPGTSGQVEVYGAHWIYIEDPDAPNELLGTSDAIKRATATLLWFSDDIDCTGPNAPTKTFEPGDAKVIRLVDG